MRAILLVTGLTACGAADAGPADLMFDLLRIDVGHPTASVLILDQDADGSLDVLVTGSGNLTVLRGNGAGAFEVDDVIAAGENPVDVAAGDIDRDGRMDLVIANHETGYLTLLFGGESGLGSGRSERLSIDVSPHPHAVALEDVDGDGFLDLLVDDRDRERLRVYRGHGDGSFEPGESIRVGGDPYRGMTLADINGDGHVDLVTPNPRTVAIQLGDGTGSFSSAPVLASAAAPPFSTSVGDFNGDGLLDVAAGSGEGAGRLMLWFGRGDGSFELDPNAPYAIAEGPTSLSASDVNGDGTDDVLVTSYLGNEVAIALGGQEEIRVVRIGLADNPWGVAAGDLNGDGRTDLVTAHDGGNEITVLLALEGRSARGSPQRAADTLFHPTEPGPRHRFARPTWDVGVGFVRIPPDPDGPPGTAPSDTILIRTGPEAGASLEALAFHREGQLVIEAARPGLAAGDLEVGYEETALPVLEIGPDGRWVRVSYALDPDGVSVSGWVDGEDAPVEVVSWSSWFGAPEVGSSLGAYYFIDPDRIAFQEEPEGAPISIELEPATGSQRYDYALYGLRASGPWMEVRVATPSDYCVLPEDADSVRSRRAWIRFLDESGRPLVWYPTRGC
jgi:hypothetical protein